MQPLRKKITQSLKTKQKIMQPLGTKNHSTSRDKQKYTTSQKNKNHTTTQDKKIIQIGLNSSNKIKYGLILSNMVQYAKKKNTTIIMNLIGWPLNPDSPGSSCQRVTN